MKKRTKIILFLLVFILLGLTFYLLTRPDYPVLYTVTNLGTLGGRVSLPIDINEKGHVIGRSDKGGPGQISFLWTPDDGMMDLGDFQSVRMNDEDWVVGMKFVPRQGFSACLWSPEEGLIDLGIDSNGESVSLGINNHSVVVGETGMRSGTPRGFIWSATDGARILDPDWRVFDVNDAGHILCATKSEVPFIYDLNIEEIVDSDDNLSGLMLPDLMFSQVNWESGQSFRSAIPRFHLSKDIKPPEGEGFVTLVNDSNENQTVGTIIYSNPTFQNILQQVGPNSSFLIRRFERVLVEISIRDSFLSSCDAVLWQDGQTQELTNHIPEDSGLDHIVSAQAINASGQIAAIGRIGTDYRAVLLAPIEHSEIGN